MDIIVDEDGNVSMTKLNADLFCAKIENLCAKLGYTPKDRETNMTRLISSIKIVKQCVGGEKENHIQK